VRWKLTHQYLAQKLADPEVWSIADRDAIGFFIEDKREELDRTPKLHQPLRRGREEALAELEHAMQVYIDSRNPWRDEGPNAG